MLKLLHVRAMGSFRIRGSSRDRCSFRSSNAKLLLTLLLCSCMLGSDVAQLRTRERVCQYGRYRSRNYAFTGRTRRFLRAVPSFAFRPIVKGISGPLPLFCIRGGIARDETSVLSWSIRLARDRVESARYSDRSVSGSFFQVVCRPRGIRWPPDAAVPTCGSVVCNSCIRCAPNAECTHVLRNCDRPPTCR